MNAIRGFVSSDYIDNDTIKGNHELLSLGDIIKRQTTVGQQAIESYIMVNEHMHESRDSNSEDKVHDITLVVKRANLIFNDKECLVLNFSDITALKLLRSEEQKTKLMSNLYSSVHHEMLGPLKSNEEAARCLIEGLTDPNLITLARISLLCTK